MKRRCDRNRKRSKRRAIYCPLHGCYLDSSSQKHPLFADKIEHLRERGHSHRNASMVVKTYGTVPLLGEWLEAFWCPECQETKWYHIHKEERKYDVYLASPELWQQVSGVIDPRGNVSVSEFTLRQARRKGAPKNCGEKELREEKSVDNEVL